MILDGKKIAASVRAEWKLRAEKLAQHGAKPGLAVIIVGDDPASALYVKNKIKACNETGIFSEVHSFSGSVEQQQVLDCIQALNKNVHIHGILVQLPLPSQFENNRIITSIAFEKDVEGFHFLQCGCFGDG